MNTLHIENHIQLHIESEYMNRNNTADTGIIIVKTHNQGRDVCEYLVRMQLLF